ncbi:PKD domain-containing protein [Ornithinimicrobium sp. W1665]|uniref:PKD domain-containing protein n=1 Tax=Ornithinimicrobium sp. W1665 TaxID=3416666 RepID=UPI003D6C2AD6
MTTIHDPAGRRLPGSLLRRRTVAVLATAGVVATGATVALAEVTVPNPTSLSAVGPVSGEHGYPTWYRDSEGLRLEQCLDLEDPYCDPAFLRGEMPDPESPISFPDNWPLESFYFLAGAEIDMPTGGKGVLVYGLEATMANEATVDGDQVVFGRVRFDLDLPSGGTYEVVHPYGVDTFTVTDAEADGFRYVEDITPAPGNFGLALRSRINPFLVGVDGLIETPDGNRYVGDPAVPTRVTGSPHGTNEFRVDQLLDDGTRATVAATDQFSLMGKVSTNSGIDPQGAFYAEGPSGRWLDVHAVTDVNESVSVEGEGVVRTTLDADGGRYFGRLPLPQTVPGTVTFTNDSDRPVATRTLPVTDRVTVTTATYDTATDELTVTATSSDEVDPPVLTVDGLTDAAGSPVVLTGGTVTTTTTAPPASVTVTSAAGGSATTPVTVTGPQAAQAMPTVAMISGPTEVLVGQPVTLTSASHNADSLLWDQVAGPDVGIAGQTGQEVTFTAPAEETSLAFTLTAVGSGGTHTSASYAVAVVTEATPPPPPAGPVATATASPAEAPLGRQVTVSAADSTGATGYAWTQTAGTSVPLADPTAASFTFPMPASAEPLVFEVTVTGADGQTASSTVTVTQVVDQLTVGQAQYRADKSEWRVSGTASVTWNNTVKVWVRNADGTKGALVGEGLVSAPVAPATTGDWGIRVRGGVNPGASTQLVVESVRGGTLQGVTFQRR